VEPARKASDSIRLAAHNMGRRASNSIKLAAHNAGQMAQGAARTWVLALARFGLVIRGLVYGLIGVLAAEAAVGVHLQTTDTHGALITIYRQPFGEYLLGIVAIGLFSYALWSFVLGVLDLDQQGGSLQGLGARVGHLGAGVSYSVLGVGAARLLLGLGTGGRSSDAATQDYTGLFLDLPYGTHLVVAAGIVVIGIAAFILYLAVSGRFVRQLALERAFGLTRYLIYTVGRLGYAAFGVVLAIVGSFLVVAALAHNPGEAVGLGGALAEVASQPYGQVLLGIVAAGLMAYGLYSVAEARYRRVR
jgi:hypothetical protein